MTSLGVLVVRGDLRDLCQSIRNKIPGRKIFKKITPTPTVKIAYCYLEQPTNLYDEPLQHPPVEQHGDEETEEIHRGQGLEHHHGADRVAGVD